MNTPKPILFLTGQNGLLGNQIKQSLSDHYQIIGLQRDTTSPDKPSWNYHQMLQQFKIKAPAAVIHLAGAGIADKRWSQRHKKTIFDSRIKGTQWLANEILNHDEQPIKFICASAIGYYGDRPFEKLDEKSAKGDNFVADVAENWELAAKKLQSAHTQVINLRFGMILSKHGGALKNMITPFKLGLGGRLGKGQQQYSWISINDAVKAIRWLLDQANLSGVYNLTSPNPVTNQVFTQSLAQTLKRPAFMHMPTFLVRFIFGEMADELLLADTHVLPTRLLTSGFEFDHPELKPTLNKLLK